MLDDECLARASGEADMTGFVAAYREVVDHPLFAGNSERLGAWMWLVMKAAWKPVKFDISGKIVTIQRGQLCVSRAQLSKAWGMSPSGVERFLTRLKTEQMIGQETGQGRSIITICNYSKYQDISEQAGQATGQATGQPSDSDRTAKEQGNKGTRVIEPNGPITQGAGECDIQIDGNVHRKPVSKPKKASRKSAPFVESAFELPHDIPAEPWAAYVAMRSATGKPIKTVSGANGMISMLRRFAEDGHPPGEVLRQSVAFEWQGLFPIKTGTVKNGTGNHYTATAPISHNPMVQAGIEREAKRLGGEQAAVQSDAYHWA